MTTKADKSSIKRLYEHVARECVLKQDILDLEKRSKQAAARLQSEVKEQQDYLESLEKELNRAILREVRAATAHLKVSIYDEDNPDEVVVDTQSTNIEQSGIIDQVRKLLDRKLDKQEYSEEMRTKLSKKDHEMSL